VFGHNGLSGISNDYEPPDAPDDFERTSREWYLNKAGTFNSDLYFELEKAAGGGASLPIGEQDSLYVLLWRSDLDVPFQAIAYPDQILGSILVFNAKDLYDGYYAIGYASTVIPLTSYHVADMLLQEILISPNPARDHLTVYNGNGTWMNIYSAQGLPLEQIQLSNVKETIDLSSFSSGFYLIEFNLEGKSITKKMIIQ